MELPVLLSVLLVVTPMLMQHGDANVIRDMDVGPQEAVRTVEVVVDSLNEPGAGAQAAPDAEDGFNKHWQSVVGDTEHVYKIKEIKSIDFDKFLSTLYEKQQNGARTDLDDATVKEEYAEKDIVKEVDQEETGATAKDGYSKVAANGVVINDNAKEERVENKIVEQLGKVTVKEINAEDSIGNENKIKAAAEDSQVREGHKEGKPIKEQRKTTDSKIIKEIQEKTNKEDLVQKEIEEREFVKENIENVAIVEEQEVEGDYVTTINKVEDIETEVRPTEGIKSSEKIRSDPIVVLAVDQNMKTTENALQADRDNVLETFVPIGEVANDKTTSSQDEPEDIVGTIAITTDTYPDVYRNPPMARIVREFNKETPSPQAVNLPTLIRSYYDVDRVPQPEWLAKPNGNEAPTSKHPPSIQFSSKQANSSPSYHPQEERTLQGQRDMNKLFPQSRSTLPQRPSASASVQEESTKEQYSSSVNANAKAQELRTTTYQESYPKFDVATPVMTVPKIEQSESKGGDKIDLDQKLEAQSTNVHSHRCHGSHEYNEHLRFLPQLPKPHSPSVPLGAILYPVFIPLPAYPLLPPGFSTGSENISGHPPCKSPIHHQPHHYRPNNLDYPSWDGFSQTH